MTQIGLPLAWAGQPGDERFLVTAANERAVHLLEHWGAWPVRTAILTGSPRSGRSLLARLFAAKSGGRVIDDAGGVAEDALFHAWNEAQTSGRPLVIVADRGWRAALPDLASRLAASTHAAIGPPDDTLVRALLDHGFARRRLDARPDLIDWLAARLERSYTVVERVIDHLDAHVTERQRRLSIPLARATLAEAGLIGPPPAPERP